MKYFMTLALVVFMIAVSNTVWAQETDPHINRLMNEPANKFAVRKGSGDTLYAWLDSLLTSEHKITWTRGNCGEASKATEISTCITAEIKSVSRYRLVFLNFSLQGVNFIFDRGFMMSLSGSSNYIPIYDLDQLPDMMTTPVQLTPLKCSEGAFYKVQKRAGRVVESCDREGTPHGGYREWYQQGLFLHSKGRYNDGEKLGRWTECDPSEKCTDKVY